MTELPTFVTNQIERLSEITAEQQVIEYLLLRWFRNQGYLNAQSAGTIKDLLTYMQVDGISSATTIKLIQQVISSQNVAK